MDPLRLAKVATRSSGGLRLATGYLVTEDLVLTAAHAIAGSERLSVRFSNGNDWEQVSLVWSGGEERDAALLRLAAPRPPNGAVQFGRCERLRAEWVGGGFPSAGAQDDVRESVGVGGRVEPLGGAVSGLYDLTVEGAAPSPELWQGLSGGPVFVERVLVGVLRSVPKTFAGRRLWGTPVATLFDDSEFKRLVGQPALLMLGGGEPSPSAIVTEHHRLRFGDGAPVLERRAGTAAPPAPQARQVEHRPRASVGFLDRKETLARTTGRLLQGVNVNIEGPDGVGKTSLLRVVGQTQCPEDCSGLVYVNAAGLSVADLLQDLHDRFYESPDRLKVTPGLFQQRFANLRALVLLDDATLSAAEFERLLNLAPRLTFAVVGRQAMGYSSDWRCESLSGLPLEECKELLERTLGRALHAAELPVAEQLARTAEGHPQTLLNYAAQARRESIELTVLLNQLAGSTRTEQRQRLLGVLGRRELKYLVALSVFGGILLSAGDLFALTGGPSEETLERLLSDGLLVADGDDYQLAPSTPSLAPDPALERQVLEHLMAWAQRAAHQDRSLLARALRIRRALGIALESQHAPQAIQLAQALEPGLARTGMWDAWRGLVESVSSAATRIGDSAAQAWAAERVQVLERCWPRSPAVLPRGQMPQSLEQPPPGELVVLAASAARAWG